LRLYSGCCRLGDGGAQGWDGSGEGACFAELGRAKRGGCLRRVKEEGIAGFGERCGDLWIECA